MADEATSAAPEMAAQETAQQAASAAPSAQAQEQRPGQRPDIAVEEMVRRRVQSQLDKVRRETEKRLREQMQAEAERLAWQRKLEEMTDEELGAFVREDQRVRAQIEAQKAQVLAQAFQGVQEETLAIVPDEKDREELRARSEAGEFRSYSEFLRAATELAVKHQTAREKERLTKELQQAVQNDAVANQVERSGPQLGAGIPTQQRDTREMSADELIRAGLKEVFKEL